MRPPARHVSYATPPSLRPPSPLHLDRFPVPSHPSSSLAAPQNFCRRQADRPRLAGQRHKCAPPRLACHSASHTTCTAPPSQVKTLFGIIFFWVRILLYICSFDPLFVRSFIVLSSKTSRSLCQLSLFSLGFRPSNLAARSSTLHPPSRFRIQFHLTVFNSNT